MKRLHIMLLFVLLTVLCSAVASAASFTVGIQSVDDDSDKIYKDEVAEFYVTIENSDVHAESYILYTLDPSWIVYTDNTLIKVEAGEEKTFKVYVDPTSSIVKSGIYSLNLDIKSNKGDEVVKTRDEIIIKSEQQRQFSPAVSAFVTIGEDSVVDPRADVDVKIRLVNRNALDISKLTVFVKSAYFEDSYSSELSPNSELIKTLTFPIDKYTAPGNDTLVVQVNYDGSIITDKRVEYEIQENKLFFTRISNVTSKFMFKDYKVTLENVGNVHSEEEFQYPISWFANVFTKTNPDATFVSGNVSVLEFDIALDPAEVQVVTITTDYRATFYTLLTLIILVVLLLTAYYTFRSPILVTKKATIVAEKDGGTSEIKILLNIRNRTNKMLENIVVVDRIPDITEIEEEFTLGTLKPSKIVRSGKKGTLIRWNFPAVEGYEERLITYKIHSKLGILGNFSLPPTLVKFDLPTGRTRGVRSKAVEKSE